MSGGRRTTSRGPAKPEWVEHLNGLSGREFLRLAGVWLLVALVALVAAWAWASPQWAALPAFPAVDWWAVGLTVAFLVELRAVWRLLLPPAARATAGLGDRKLVTRALQAVFPQAPRQEADRTPLILEGFKHAIEAGTETLVCKLPAGMTVTRLLTSDGRATFLSVLDLDLDHDRIELSKDRGRENWLRVTIKAPPFAAVTRVPDWIYRKRPVSDPFVYGVDARAGQDVAMPLFNKKGRFIGAGALIAGTSGYGKSSLLRLIFAYARSLDGGLLWMADGKAARGEDFERARHAANRSVCQIDRDAKTKYLGFVQALRGEVERRYSEPGPHPPLIAVFDEYAALRRMIGKGTPLLDAHDEDMEDIVQRCRGAAIFLVFATQHPSVDAIPSAIRDQCSVRLSFYMPSGRSLKMVFDEEPPKSERPPQTPGRALVEVDGVLTHVLVDHLDDGPWAAWCRAQPAVNGPQDALMPAGVPQDALRAVPTLASEVRRIVDRPMSVSELLGQLPEALRPGSADQLSRALRDLGIVPRRTNKGAVVTPEMVEAGVTSGVTSE